ncbi:MAG: ADP-ribosylglycohydrolase family protein [Isosphaeraceae bacterium]
MKPDLSDRLSGVLLGTALGDALGLPAEGMSRRAIARRFGRVDRFRLLGQTGFVSDDTEQAALVAQSLIRHPDDPGRCGSAFRRSLLGWFCRLPFGVGLGTVRACLRIALGIRPTGVFSAGNGSAMRAAVIGVFFRDFPDQRLSFGREIAMATHRDPRAVEGALFVAELAAHCASADPNAPRDHLVQAARSVVTHQDLVDAIERAATATEGVTPPTSGFVLHSVPFALYVFSRKGDDVVDALAEAVGAGGDTDSNAAILGAWLGALHGASGLPTERIARIHDGPFGPTHLRALGAALAAIQEGGRPPVPGYSTTAALARNLALLPVVLAHGIRRLWPT